MDLVTQYWRTRSICLTGNKLIQNGLFDSLIEMFTGVSNCEVVNIIFNAILNVEVQLIES